MNGERYRAVKGVVDRVEEGIAVIQLEGGGDVFFPAERLPQDSKEGSVIELVVRLDKKATGERKEIVRKRQEGLR